MADLIDRHEAIDIVRNIIVKEVTPAYALIDKAEVMTELMMMPPAEPELAQDLHNACIDAISRQAAIELIENESRKWGDEYGVSDVLCDLADLPAAQPEERTNKSTKTHACDCVSRRAAIDAVVGCTNCGTEDVLRAYVAKHYLDNGWTGGIVDALDAIEQLPSAQPELAQDLHNACIDAISRQAAIDTFEPWLKVEGYSEGELNMLKAVLYELHCLPSAQTEIIQCKDCKHSIDFYGDGECYCRRPNKELDWIGDWNFYCGCAERREK